MHLFYVDESYDNEKFVISAVGLRAENWRLAVGALQAFRQSLRTQFGIKVTREIHASEFIRNCSDNIADRKLNHGFRKHAYELCLRQIASMRYVRIINICLDVPPIGHDLAHFRAIERLMNRINKTMDAKNSHALAIFDAGKEREIEGLARKMSVFNPVPSRFGIWPNGSVYRNITTERVLEDPVFRPSHRSLLLQCADHAAFALLKREVAPAPFIRKWGYHRLFPILAPARFLAAAPRDPDGIVR